MQENIYVSQATFIQAPIWVTNRGLRRSSSLLSLPGKSNLRRLLLIWFIVNHKLPWDTTIVLQHSIQLLWSLCVSTYCEFSGVFTDRYTIRIWRMRRQLIPGLVVRPSDIKTKTRPGNEASLILTVKRVLASLQIIVTLCPMLVSLILV